MSICIPMNSEFPLGDCYKSTGGLANIYIASKSNIETVAPELDAIDDEGLITGTTMEAGTFFYDYTPLRFTANYVLTPQVNEFGTVGYDIVLTLPFQKNEADTRNAIKMMRGSDLAAMVKDANGTYILLGEEYGLKVEASYDSGTAMADHNRWEIKLVGMESQEPREMDPDIVAALIYTA